MKKLLYIAVLAFVFNACGGDGGGGGTPPPVENTAPSTPSLVYPGNNELCIDNSVNFSWGTSTDSEGDPITYTFQVALDQGFTQVEHSISSTATSQVINLDKGVAYYWRILATDSKGASSNYSSTNQFYTEGEGETNHLPFAPVLGGPALNSIVTEATATLSWTASDVDGDSLTYDVYFETGDTPTQLAAENISENTYVVNVSGSSSYSWKVVVKDGQGGETIGQIWNFKTD